ncbi:MAG: hypothetical protein VX768_14265 [Planctomycetota bacterium]|nr:hypothetical protein [Planctomycetota bacterium]
MTLSLLAVLHLFIVFSSPWAMPEPSSQLARDTSQLTSRVADLLYMKHGYRFFAPDPGPSHLIHFEVARADGTTVRGSFPDRKQHVPRLLYHRYFMISEHFWNLGISQQPDRSEMVAELLQAEEYLRNAGLLRQADWVAANRPGNGSESLTADQIKTIADDLKKSGQHHAARTAIRTLNAVKQSRETADRHRDVWLNGIASYLKKKHGGQTVRIWIQEHMIPDFDHMLDGGQLNDDSNYGPKQLVYSEDEVIQ